MSENVGASASRNPKGFHGLYRKNFTLPLHKGNIETMSDEIQDRYQKM
jgi:hypothetical protein